MNLQSEYGIILTYIHNYYVFTSSYESNISRFTRNVN